MTRATEHFTRPANLTAADARTLACPRWAVAWRTCERTGPAFEVTRAPALAPRLVQMAVQLLALVGFFGVLFVGLACAHG